MAKRKSMIPTYKPEAGADFGPSLRLNRKGRFVAWGGAAAINVEHRDDPAVVDHRRIVRGARRRDTLTDLLARRIITKRMVDAAEQFLEDCSIASGGRSASEGYSSPSGSRAGLPERQVNAIGRVNRVRLVLGLNTGTVFWCVVFENISLAAYEKRYFMRSGSATELLKAALAALDEHYHRYMAHKVS